MIFSAGNRNRLPGGTKTFNNEVAPRFSIMRKGKAINIYSSISKGFSPPTTTELLPTGSAINTRLNAEDGWNYDVGLKGNLFKTLSIDINAFWFSLQNTIVQRRDAGGGEMFINAGKTDQKGVETSLNYPISSWSVISTEEHLGQPYISPFKYEDFKQLTNDFSGNSCQVLHHIQLPPVMIFGHATGFQVRLTYFYSDAIPLNDANNAYADAYHLLGAKNWLGTNR